VPSCRARVNLETTKPVIAPQDTKTRLRREDYGIIVDWMENAENRHNVTGARGSPGGRPRLTKAAAYESLADLVKRSTTTRGLGSLDAGAMMQRCRTYKKKFDETYTKAHGTGFGLNLAEVEKGMTLEAKLDGMCPHCAILCRLFGANETAKPRQVDNVSANIYKSVQDLRR